MLKTRYQDWRYWRKFGPKYEMVSHGKLQIGKISSNNYKLTLLIAMSFESRDTRDFMWIECNCVRVGFDSLKLKHRQREYYQLQTAINTIRLPPGGKEKVEFILVADHYPAEPLLGDTAICRWVNLGAAYRGCNINARPLKLLGRFEVEVDKSDIPTVS